MTIDATFPNTSPPEAVRVVLALIGFCAAFYGLAHTTDGMAAFATPIRARMVGRRRLQMAGSLVVFASLGLQALIVSTTPDSYPLSLQTLTGNLALIVVSATLMFVTLNQALGWLAFEEILGKTPLVPPPDAYVAEMSLTSRGIVHAINGDLQLIVGEADLLAADPTLTVPQRAAVMRLVDCVATVTRRMVDVQQLIRSLSPDVPPTTSQEPKP